MTQTITKNIVVVAFVATLFSILLAMPQAQAEAKVSISDISIMKNRAMASTTAISLDQQQT